MNIDIPLARADLRSLRVEIEGRVVRLESAGTKCSVCVEYNRIICPD